VTDRVFILGAGRAGRGFARAFRVSGVDVVGLHGRRTERTPDAVTAGALPAALGKATAIIVAVRDAQLDDALGEIAIAQADRRAAELFKGAWVGVDGDAAAIATADRLAGRLGAHTLRIPPGEKARYHAAAVLASNFPTVLATLAALLLTDAGVPPHESWDAVRSLMRGAVLNLDTDTPLAALTGPVMRGDAETIRRHLAALAGAPELRRVYVELSRAAVEIARAGGAEVDAVEKVLASGGL